MESMQPIAFVHSISNLLAILARHMIYIPFGVKVDSLSEVTVVIVERSRRSVARYLISCNFIMPM